MSGGKQAMVFCDLPGTMETVLRALSTLKALSPVRLPRKEVRKPERMTDKSSQFQGLLR